MISETAHRLARALLYEGYLLYPYRPSAVKNRRRFNWGVLLPRTFAEAYGGAESWRLRCECLVEGGAAAAIEVEVRFLQLVERRTRLGQASEAWREAIERTWRLGPFTRGELLDRDLRLPFSVDGSEEVERTAERGAGAPEQGHAGHTGHAADAIVRTTQALVGEVVVVGRRETDGITRLTCEVTNLTVVAGREASTREAPSREDVLPHSLVSTHVVLGTTGGRFVSLLEPPEPLSALAATCRNEGVFPVLVGPTGTHDAMLCSPIILYDHPAIAPQSAGDLFDGTEMDEMLSLRIMTLTEDERREMRETDTLARRVLDRTDGLGADDLLRMHGVLRRVDPVDGGVS